MEANEDGHDLRRVHLCATPPPLALTPIWQRNIHRLVAGGASHYPLRRRVAYGLMSRALATADQASSHGPSSPKEGRDEADSTTR
jgi:hypothetical protein